VTAGFDPTADPASPTSVLDEPTAGGKIIRGGLLRTLAYGAGVALGIVSAALMTRHLGVEDFGRYVTVFAIVTVAASLSEVGMSNIGIREYSVREGEDRDALMRNLLGLRLTLATLATAVAVAFAAVAGYPAVMVAGTALACTALLINTVQQTVGVPLSAGLRLGWVSALDIVRQIGMAAVVVALVLAGADLLPFLAAPTPVAIGMLVFTAVLVRGTVPFFPALDPRSWSRLVRLVLPYAAASAVGAIYVNLVVVLTSLAASPEETGYFGASFRVFTVLSAVPWLLVASAFPVLARAARDDRLRLKYALQRLWDISLLVGAGGAVLTAIGAEVAIDLVAGSGYEPSVSVLRIQSLALFASFLVATWGYGLLSLGAYRSLLIANAIALGLSFALALVLAPEYGADGAAVATVVGEGGLALAYGLQLMRRRPDLRVDLGLLPRVVLAAALAAAVVLLPGIPQAAELLLAAIVYLGAIVALRAIPVEIWAALRQREPPQ
jgi:O-antigen/teichoic acid export membrane protein